MEDLSCQYSRYKMQNLFKWISSSTHGQRLQRKREQKGLKKHRYGHKTVPVRFEKEEIIERKDGKEDKESPYLVPAVQCDGHLVRVGYLDDAGLHHPLCQRDGVEGEQEAADHNLAPANIFININGISHDFVQIFV